MFKRNKREKILEKKMDLLIDILEKSNLKDLIYILGKKKQIIERNLIAGICRGIGIGIRNNSNYSNTYLYASKNSIT